MRNTITILKTRERNCANKTFRKMPDGRIKLTPYACGDRFEHWTYDVGDLQDVYALVRGVEDDPRQFIVHGEVIPQFRERDHISRTLHDDPSKQQVAMLREIEAGHNVMVVDFDHKPMPPGLTPQQAVEHYVHTLPEEFHNASYCFQFSSSSGVAGEEWQPADAPPGKVKFFPGWRELNVHVWFWLSRPWRNLSTYCENLNATRGHRVFDPAPLRTVQPLYLARPTFEDMDDPLSGDARHGLVLKARDDVDLVWIDRPPSYVQIERHGETETVRVGAIINTEHRGALIATPSLMDRIGKIGEGGEYREPLKKAIGYYYWLSGKAGRADEITALLLAQFPGGLPGGRDYLQPRKLTDLIDWFSRRATHEPFVPSGTGKEQAWRTRLVAWRDGLKPLPDTEIEETYDDWLLDEQQTSLSLNFVMGECGLGKTYWLIDLLNDSPGRYIVCLPRIELIREVEARLYARHPAVKQNKGYVIETIYTDRISDIRDAEDRPDDDTDHAERRCNGKTVTQQVAEFRAKHKKQPRVILFITHAALLLGDWHEWTSYQLFVDEIPDPYLTYTRDFANTSAFVRSLIEPVDDGETNYHRLGLTDAGYEKIAKGRFDFNEKPIEGLMQSIARPNGGVYALRSAWDGMAEQRVQLMRLTDANFLSPFKTVTIMGDEFDRSMLALAFEQRYGVRWISHPDWHPIRKRKVPLAKRARIFYFSKKDQRRGSVTQYDDRKLIPRLIKWFSNPEHVPGTVLMTANRKFENLFETVKTDIKDRVTADGRIETTLTQSKYIKVRYAPPRLAGTDIYKAISNIAFFAAMRPGVEEVNMVSRALLIAEEAIIRWREYNVLFQFVMRGVLRDFDSAAECNIYVWDEYQAEYLIERFGGCLECTCIAGLGQDTNKGGRPSKNKTADEQRARKTEEKRKLRAAKKAAQAAQPKPVNEFMDRLDKAIAKARSLD